MFLVRFRWAVCQLDALGKCLTVPMLRKALGSLPSTLDETYARILGNIDESWGRSVARIFEWLMFSAAPLRLTEVAELVAIDIDEDPPFDPTRRLPEPKDILTMCSSLITLTQEKRSDKTRGHMNYEEIIHEYEEEEDVYASNEQPDLDDNSEVEESKIIVRLAHFSVREYLGSRRLRIGPTFYYEISEAAVHVRITEMCLIYLFQFDKPDALKTSTLDTFPLLRYAARNWLFHARKAGPGSERLNALITNMFRQSDVCKNWVRVFDPERPADRPSVWQYDLQPCSPLYYCSLAGLLEPAKRLLEDGADPNTPEGDLGSSLLAALKNEHEDIARTLVDSGADVSASAPSWPVGMTALHRAARDGYESLAAALLSKGASLEVKTDAGETPLHMAVENGHMDIVKRLLNSGANVNAQDNIGAVSLFYAISNLDLPMMEVLIQSGAAIDARDNLGRTSVFIAVETKQQNIIQLLLDKSPNMRVADLRGQGLIHYAAANGLVAIVKLLPDDIETKDHFGRTALHIAADAGQKEVIKFLMRAGAKHEVCSNSGQTPLFYAAVAGHVDAVRVFVDAGANLKARDDFGASILYATATAGDLAADVVDLLISEIERRSKSGRSLLHHAVIANDIAMVKRLIRGGVDIHAKTARGETPLWLAMTHCHDDIIRLLRRANTTPHSDASESDDE